MVSIVWGPQKEHETGLCIRTFWHSFRVLAHTCHLGLTEWHSRGGDRRVTWLLEEEADCRRGCLIVHYGLAWGPYDTGFVVLGFQHPFHKGTTENERLLNTAQHDPVYMTTVGSRRSVSNNLWRTHGRGGEDYPSGEMLRDSFQRDLTSKNTVA